MAGARPRRLADYVAHHARHRPNQHAVAGIVRATYPQLDRHISRIAAALAGCGLPPGAVVAVAHDDPYARLVLTLGFECLDIVVALFAEGETDSLQALWPGVDLVVLSAGVLPDRHDRVLRADDAWLRAALTARATPGADERPHAAADAPVLCLRSSGTTGAPKSMLLSRRALDLRVRQRARLLGMTRGSRCLLALHLKVGGAYYNAAACLRLGATVVLPAAPPLRHNLVEHDVTHVTLLPLQLGRLLASLPEQAVKRPGLTLCLIGARLPQPLRRRALQEVCGRIVSLYSTSEAGGIAVVDETGTGQILEGVETVVLDERGAPLPPGPVGRWAGGPVGRIVVRSEATALGYALSPRGPVTPFQDGWFETGDFGAWTGDGRLQVLGRHDDVVNLAGIKMACADVEARVAQLEGVSDLAVFAETGVTQQTLVVCVVTCPGYDRARTLAAIRSALPGRVRLQEVAAIPRTPDGKVRRAPLRRLAAAMAGERPGGV